MEAYIYLCLAAFGLIIGSFLNVVILRFDTGASIATGRSKCFSCNKTLSWYELVPVLSYVFQRGRCRECEARISWQYPVVELLGALALPAAYSLVPGAFHAVLPFVAFLVTAKLLCVYVVIAVYDLRHKIIPDFFSYLAVILAIASIVLDWISFGSVDLTRLLAGPALFLFFFFFWAVSRGGWMGLGDAKLALSVGWFLGMSHGIASVLLAFWTGAVASLLTIALQKAFSRKGGLAWKSEVPFGPYILLGFLLSLLFNIDLAAIASVLAV